MNITKAEITDLDALVVLFNDYRIFYEQESELTAAKDFLSARLINDDSVILIAKDDAGKALGFTQCYPTFCSIQMKPRWILHDLFVAKEARRQGVAEMLMQATEALAKETGRYNISLETANDNYPGQNLYEKLGYERDTVFLAYAKVVV